MKERPILFSAPTVRAILDGKKTQTRRIVKPQPPAYIDELHGNDLRGRAPYRLEHDETGAVLGSGFQDDNDNLYKCPYGTPGDRLWVRECWTPDHRDFYPHFPAVYKADAAYDYDRNEKGEVYSPEQKSWYPYRWRPSIHMPRWASRITLEVVAVRVERLHEISDADSLAEGVASDRQRESTWYEGKSVEMFRKLWQSINGPESWSANPWVWVVEFKRLEQVQ